MCCLQNHPVNYKGSSKHRHYLISQVNFTTVFTSKSMEIVANYPSGRAHAGTANLLKFAFATKLRISSENHIYILLK